MDLSLNSPARRALLIGAIVLTVALDQATKALVQANLAYREFVEITPFFNLCHAVNHGAAFSFLGSQGGWQVLFFAAIALAVTGGILRYLWRNAAGPVMTASLVLLAGGAVGNLIDRVTLGVVVDFLDFHVGVHHWPAFNVADIAICTGAAGLILLSFIGDKNESSKTDKAK